MPCDVLRFSDAWSGYNPAIDTIISGNPAGEHTQLHFPTPFLGGMGGGIGRPVLDRDDHRVFPFSYISPVSPLQKWFLDKRGLASGFAVGRALIAQYGVVKTFVVVGFTYLGVCLLTIPVLRVPPPGYSLKGITVDTVKGTENLNMIVKGAETEGSTDTGEGEEKAAVNVDVQEGKEGNEVGGGMGDGNGDGEAKQAVLEVSPTSPLAAMQAMNLVDAISSIKNQFHKDANEASTINAVFAIFTALGRISIPYLVRLHRP
ncbi:hypothetical protein HDU93_006125 [Gonapodya sp. JEL0774]|nr:hypothetical protein HDU93_006125 [Gonapodya sp. JEL0774]